MPVSQNIVQYHKKSDFLHIFAQKLKYNLLVQLACPKLSSYRQIDCQVSSLLILFQILYPERELDPIYGVYVKKRKH